MAGVFIHQRCWNHELREAVCRCPACGRHFCRECVTEHASRLLCAACLQSLTRTAPARRGVRVTIAPLAALASLLLSWWIFYTGGEILLEITTRLQQTIAQTMEQPWLLR
jgi:hypothetical protein